MGGSEAKEINEKQKPLHKSQLLFNKPWKSWLKFPPISYVQPHPPTLPKINKFHANLEMF